MDRLINEANYFIDSITEAEVEVDYENLASRFNSYDALYRTMERMTDHLDYIDSRLKTISAGNNDIMEVSKKLIALSHKSSTPNGLEAVAGIEQFTRNVKNEIKNFKSSIQRVKKENSMHIKNITNIKTQLERVMRKR